MSNRKGEYGRGGKKRDWSKSVVAIWTCFLLVSQDFQICWLGFFFGIQMMLLIMLAACSVRLGLSPQVLLFRVTVQNLHSIICSNSGHNSSSRWFFMPQGLEWFLLFSKTNCILMRKLMYWKMTPNGIKLHFAN